jgi:hypothetical protein
MAAIRSILDHIQLIAFYAYKALELLLPAIGIKAATLPLL